MFSGLTCDIPWLLVGPDVGVVFLITPLFVLFSIRGGGCRLFFSFMPARGLFVCWHRFRQVSQGKSCVMWCGVCVCVMLDAVHVSGV